jgi:hypothetical protein
MSVTTSKPMPLRLYLIRHGETEWSLSGQYTGLTDIPLTAHGEDTARDLGQRLHGIPFAHVLTSPLQRAQQTCALAGLTPVAEIKPDLAEWDNGDYEGRTPADILRSRPGWNLFRDGAPRGETPVHISIRADRLIAHLRVLEGNVALFSHSHFGRVLAARWIGLSVEQAQYLLLSTASISVLCFEHDYTDQPAIALWNSATHETFDPAPNQDAGDIRPMKRWAIQRWKDEEGEIPSEQRNQERVALLAHMKRRFRKGHSPMKKLIVFDLDGTLVKSKSSLDAEMSTLLSALLGVVKVAVISGGNWPQFQKQVLSLLPQDQHLKNLSLLPTCGTKFYKYHSGWKQLYAEDFTDEEKTKIIGSLKQVIESSDFKAEETWGEQIEDRGSQITFSALGQQAPLEEKKKWDPDFAKRKKMKKLLDEIIPGFSVRLGGTTSVDVTKPGIDKAYGIRKLHDILGIAIEEMIFVGDALFPGGNDYPAKEAGVESIQVRDTEESKRVIETIIACLCGVQPNKLREEESR